MAPEARIWGMHKLLQPAEYWDCNYLSMPWIPDAGLIYSAIYRQQINIIQYTNDLIQLFRHRINCKSFNLRSYASGNFIKIFQPNSLQVARFNTWVI